MQLQSLNIEVIKPCRYLKVRVAAPSAANEYRASKVPIASLAFSD